MASNVCLIGEPIIVHTGQAGHGRGQFLGNDDCSDCTLVIYMYFYIQCVPCFP